MARRKQKLRSNKPQAALRFSLGQRLEVQIVSFRLCSCEFLKGLDSTRVRKCIFSSRSRSSRSRCQARRPRSKLWPSARKRGVSKDRPTLIDLIKLSKHSKHKSTEKHEKCLHHLCQRHAKALSLDLMQGTQYLAPTLVRNVKFSSFGNTAEMVCRGKKHGGRAAHS